MVLVILAGLCVALFATLFKLFARYHVALLPAVCVNYLVAFLCGCIVHPPWGEEGLDVLWAPALLLGCAFVGVFFLTGRSAQVAGVARTTVASRMSLVLTVIATVLLFHERPAPLAWAGIALAFVGVWLVTWQREEGSAAGAWILPLSIFIGSAICDIGINAVEKTRTTSLTAPLLPTICFAGASAGSLLSTVFGREPEALLRARTWIGGGVLGVVNYLSLIFLVNGLSIGKLPASQAFPLMNITAILGGAAISILFFKEHIQVKQWIGVAVCAAALALIMLA